jgi:septal ring factor EnvC (AmiA/AmiB activator)
MRRSARNVVLALLSFVLLIAFAAAGCSRYANEEALSALDETQAAAVAAEQRVAELEKEKANLEAQLAEKKGELRKVQDEKSKVLSKL